ncbi:unnamed protein product, partial [Bubo scandiacus]
VYGGFWGGLGGYGGLRGYEGFGRFGGYGGYGRGCGDMAKRQGCAALSGEGTPC